MFRYAWALKKNAYIPAGWEGVVVGDVPVGAGLSSSAALELATARAFASITPFTWDAAKWRLLGSVRKMIGSASTALWIR